jgi:hypothetical protein
LFSSDGNLLFLWVIGILVPSSTFLSLAPLRIGRHLRRVAVGTHAVIVERTNAIAIPDATNVIDN